MLPSSSTQPKGDCSDLLVTKVTKEFHMTANYLQNPLAFQLGDKHFSLLTTYQEV